MGKVTIEAGDLVHASNERVKEIEIVLKGCVTATDSVASIKLPYGSIIGLFENAGELYKFDYEAEEETTIFSYPYNKPDDIAAVIKANPQICPLLTESALNCVKEVYRTAHQAYEELMSDYNEIMLDNAKLKEYYDAAAQNYKADPYIDALKEPEKPDFHNWSAEFFSKITKEQFSLGPMYCMGIIIFAGEYINYLVGVITRLSDEKIKFNQDTAQFRMTVNELKRQSGTIEKETEEALAKYSGEGEIGSIEIKNAYDTITAYAEADKDFILEFRKNLDTFSKLKDKTDQADDVRRLRRKIAEEFYNLYEKAFLKSMRNSSIPVEVKMFFLYGFIDEKLAGEQFTTQLAVLADTYKKDPEGKILSIYEWLRLVYQKKVEPSKNEFDMEYPAYLKNLYESGEIKQNQIQPMLASNEERAKYEIHNFFSLTDRITYGRISSFVPIFYEEDYIKAPADSVLKFTDVRSYIDNIRSIDYSCFCRETVYSNVGIGVTREYISTEVLPYIIMMPNSGTRGALWQEISGSKRDTPARMAIPMFSSGNTERMFATLAGEFRWEMCRREQGVRWNDVTTPSLTSEFSDYIQFYRKNRDITPELREKIKSQLQSARNSVKGVFVSDYVIYIEYESKGSLRLNKVSRGILFKYCTFPKATRETLSTSLPAYKDLVDKYNIKNAQKVHLMDIVLQKIEKGGFSIPEELKYQAEFNKR